MFDLEAIRKDFPILERTVHGRPLVYLDNAATTQKPHAVIDALVEYYEHYNSNIHRGLHTLAEEATGRYEEARLKVARFINAPGAESIIFTRNATESINLVAQGWGRTHIKAGDEIVLTIMEHHSNFVPWQMLAKETGAVLRFVDIDDEGKLRPEDWQRFVGERTKLVTLTQMSNVLGTINPVREIGALAHRYGALVFVDGAQSVPHMPVDVQDLDCDFLVFSSHKMLGPTGVGVVYARRSILEEMTPFLTGGHMISKVTLEGSTWNDLPWRFEAGTPNIADVIAFGAAIDYLEGIGMRAVRRHEIELTAYALQVLSEIPDVTLYGPKDASIRGAAVSFNLSDLHPHDVGTVLDSYGIAIRAGHHCAQPLMTRLGVVATARASFYLYNTREEVDALAQGVKEAAKFFGNVIVSRPRAGRAL
ncbi:MAG: cysteine desulfurase [Dehalococcoidia bacterium]|jgi:cysteine desulfurase/selenocysteine lyase